MPRHDPTPQSLERAAGAWERYKRMMKWMLLAAAVAVVLALLYLKMVGAPMAISLVIATVAGVGLSVLLGTGLMGLVFLSNASGHDDEATGRGPDDDI